MDGQTAVAAPSTSVGASPRYALWAGRVISALMVAFLVFDGGIKAMMLEPAVQGSAQLGYPESVVFWIGLALLVCTILYTVPRTAFLGAILLTGYLGGAVATQVRVEDPWFVFPVFVGALVWIGLYLRDERLRELVSSGRE